MLWGDYPAGREGKPGVHGLTLTDQLVRESKADLVGVGRAIAPDSYWAKKTVEILQD
jgi:2,4-dienoyl-CoA reductase-like NADH-dependent reductase (Old Yellow Enzyme family)